MKPRSSASELKSFTLQSALIQVLGEPGDGGSQLPPSSDVALCLRTRNSDLSGLPC